jgi:hypothetical protein
MVGGDDQEIVASQGRQDLGKPGIEGLESRRIAGNVAAMAVKRVEIDEIGEKQTAVQEVGRGGEHLIDERHVVGALADLARRPMGEDIADLAEGNRHAA